MKVQLLVSSWSPSCARAKKVWRKVAQEEDLELEIVDVAAPMGKQLMNDLQLKTIPALLVDGKLLAIGVQSKDEARKIVREGRSKK